MAERLVEDMELASRLRKEAGELFDRFNTAFWSEGRRGFYVVGLDGDKRQIDSMTSNMGHLLWSGIVPEERAAVVARHLVSDAMFSGWGIRTMSTDEVGYNPIGYHVGTIWPHDNSIVAMGLARYGFREEANRIIEAQLQATSFSEFRLPEAFAGYERITGRFPVPYPTACSPQAWATGAPFAFMKVLLGLDVRDGQVSVDPFIADDLGSIFIHGIHALGDHYDVRASGTTGEVKPTD
jgi:glycogen debranching enzyme